MPLSIIQCYLNESLLNASESLRRLFIGIEDGLKCAIGFLVASADDVVEEFARYSIDPNIFPSLRVEWFKLRFYKVSASNPSNWNENIMSTTISSGTLQSALLLCRGRAASTCPHDEADDNEQIQLLVPHSVYEQLRDSKSDTMLATIAKSKSISKETLKSSWTRLRKAQWTHITEPNSVTLATRFVLEVQLTDPRYCGSFFRTGLGTLQSTRRLRLCFPFPSSTSLDPCAIWLRARAGVAFGAVISELFFSPLFRKVIVTEPACNIEHSLRHYLLGRPLDNYVAIEQNNATSLSFRALPIPTTYPRLIVASLSSVQAVYEIVKSEDRSLCFVLLLVDTGMQDCWSSLKNAVKLLIPHSTVIDTRALIAKHDPFPAIPSLHAQLSSPTSSATAPPTATPIPAITFDPVPITTCEFIASSTLDNILKTWLLRETPSDPPRWELLQSNRIFFTQQAQRLDSEITTAWTSHAPLQVVPMFKVFPASGATCLLRSVAYKQSKHVAVLWISKADRNAPAQNYARDLGMSISSDCQRVLVCTDELGGRAVSKLVEALQRLASDRPLLLIIWLRLSASPVSALKPDTFGFIVSPFVESSDILQLASALKVLGNQASLDVVSNTALKSPRVEDRHMFVFVLAATRGVCIPIQKWVEQIYQNLAKFGERILNVALSIAFVSAFAVDHRPKSQCVSDDTLDIDPDTIQGSIEDAMIELRTLFPSALPYTSIKSSTCIHPFLARIFLSARFSLSWSNEYLDWKSLYQAWKLTVGTLSRREKCDSTLRSLLSERGRLAQFSPLIIEAWSSTSNLPPKDAVQQITEHLIDVLPPRIMGLHEHILISRLWRCAAQETPNKPTALISKAIDEAVAAQQESLGSANLGDKFTASQNLAIMHGVAYSINPLHFHSSYKDCDDILRKLYLSNSTNADQLDDLVRMGMKWCSSDYWQNQKLSKIYDPDDVSQLIVRGWSFDPTSARFRIFSERNVKKLTQTNLLLL